MKLRRRLQRDSRHAGPKSIDLSSNLSDKGGINLAGTCFGISSYR